MKRIALLIFCLCFSALSFAQTVSMTVTATTADYNAYAQMCGAVQSLKTNPTDSSTRSCTATEVKAFVNARIMQPYIDWKGAQNQQAAIQALPAPTLTFTTQ